MFNIHQTTMFTLVSLYVRSYVDTPAARLRNLAAYAMMPRCSELSSAISSTLSSLSTPMSAAPSRPTMGYYKLPEYYVASNAN